MGMARGVMGLLRGVGLALSVAMGAVGLVAPASAQNSPSTFNYQGRLDVDGLAYTGPATVRLQLLDSALGDNVLASSLDVPVDVVNGLFQFDTDLGTAELLQPLRFYQMDVKTPEMSEFQALTRRIVRATPIAGAAYRAMQLDSIATSVSPYPSRIASQPEANDYSVHTRHWQGFYSGNGGLLTQIALEIRDDAGTSGATLRIYRGQGPTGTLLHTQKVHLPASGEALLSIIPGVALNADEYYSWDIETAPAFVGLARSSGDPDPTTISSLGGIDYRYTAYIGEEGDMLLRATRLGVGVGMPEAGLHVRSQTTGEAARFESSDVMGARVAIKGEGGQTFELTSTGAAASEGAGKLLFRRSGGGASMALTDAGLGINTVAPTARLHVTRSGGSDVARFASGDSVAAKLMLENTSAGGASWAFGSTGLASAEGPGVLTVGNGSTYVYVMPTGRVGIGTVPATMLHVAGGTDASLGGGGFIQSGLASALNIVMDDNEIIARNNGAASPLFLNAEGGGIAIGGATPPQATVHVQSGGNISQSQGGFVQLGASTATNLSLDTNEIQVLNNGVPAQLFLNFGGGQVNVGESGNVAATALIVQGQALKPGGGSWTSLSDRRAKTDIQPMRGTLDRLLSLHGYSFRYSDEVIKQGGVLPGVQIGLMAQEVQRVFPDWVGTDDHGRLNVTERATTALMIESLRDLRAEKDAADATLRDELEAARARVRALEDENAAMRERLERVERAIGAR